MGKKRRFNYYEPSTDESTSETLNNTELPEADNQVTTEEEVGEVAEPIEVKPIIEKIEVATKKIDKIHTKKGTVNVLCNMRRSPEINESNILSVLAKGAKIEVVDTVGDFYKVKYNDVDGYIRKDLCDVY